MSKKTSLAELMGASGSQGLSLKSLPNVLGEAMPDLPRNSLGRYRLVSALRQRFGDNFRSLPGVSNLIQEFDHEVDLEDRVQRISAVKLEHFRKAK